MHPPFPSSTRRLPPPAIATPSFTSSSGRASSAAGSRRLQLLRGDHFVTLWSGRFDTAPDPAAFDFGISFGFDRQLFEDDVTGSLAWADALGAAGVLSREDADAIAGALAAI